MCEINNNLNKQNGGGLLENLSVPLGLFVLSENIEDDTTKTIFDIQTTNYVEPEVLDKNKEQNIKSQKDVVSNSLFDKLFSLISLQHKDKNKTKKNKKQIKVKSRLNKQTRKL